MEMSKFENTPRKGGPEVLPAFIHPVKIVLIEAEVFQHESKKI